MSWKKSQSVYFSGQTLIPIKINWDERAIFKEITKLLWNSIKFCVIRLEIKAQ